MTDNGCSCRLCSYDREFAQHIVFVREDHRAFFEDLKERWEHADFDAQWYRNGPLPQPELLAHIGEAAEGAMLSEMGWTEIGAEVWKVVFPASAIEAQRATTTEIGVVEDESAVAKPDAQNPKGSNP